MGLTGRIGGLALGLLLALAGCTGGGRGAVDGSRGLALGSELQDTSRAVPAASGPPTIQADRRLTVRLDGLVVQPGRPRASQPRSVLEADHAAALTAFLGTRGLVPGLALPEPWLHFSGAERGVAEWFALVRELSTAVPDDVHVAGLLASSGARGRRVVLAPRLVVHTRGALAPAEVAALANEVGAGTSIDLRLGFPCWAFEDLEADPLETLVLLRGDERVELAYPDLYGVDRDERGRVAAVELKLADQWLHANTGSGSSDDADIDTPGAWTIVDAVAAAALAAGDEPPHATVAIVDRGFDADHPFLKDHLWNNPFEPGADCADGADPNVFPDDLHGWDFRNTPAICPNTTDIVERIVLGLLTVPVDEPHGTAAAGLAGGGTGGGSPSDPDGHGVCKDCALMIVHRHNSDPDTYDSKAIRYAAEQADVINASWGYDLADAPSLAMAIEKAATDGRDGKGCVVVFAMRNDAVDNCGSDPDISAHESVVAVSASNDEDRVDRPFGYGDCLEVLAPALSNVALGGEEGPATADYEDVEGYNTKEGPTGCAFDVVDHAYTQCFYGTSPAAAIVSGVAGLVLSCDPSLSALEVRRLLMDTADRVEPSSAYYDDETGRSTKGTHGSGRVNAFEAVRVVAPTASGGRGGVDVFVRDNVLDWGNTEQPSNRRFGATDDFIAHWKSPDIKVDAEPFATSVPSTAADFEAFADENAVAGRPVRVYVRVRNRGPAAGETVRVKLLWAFAGAGLPALPSDFWSRFPGDSSDTSVWHPIGATQEIELLPYSGSAAAAGVCEPGEASCDEAAVLHFDFVAPGIVLSKPNPFHHCLLAVVDADNDPVSPASTALFAPDLITPNDNNVTHRNISLVFPPLGTASSTELLTLLNNPLPLTCVYEVGYTRKAGVRVTLEVDGLPLFVPGGTVALGPYERRTARLRLEWDAPYPPEGEVDLVQRGLSASRPVGGFTLVLREADAQND